MEGIHVVSIVRRRALGLLLASSLVGGPALAAASETQEASSDSLRRVPPGTRATLELRGWLTSRDAAPGDHFEATLAEDILVEGQVAVPAGATFVGRVAAVERAQRPSKGGQLTLVIDRLVSGDGESTPAPGTVTAVHEGEDLRGTGARGDQAAKGGVIGGILGGLIGGVDGALAGIIVGSGGALAASRGRDIELLEGTRLLVKFDGEVRVTWTWRAES